MGSIFVTGTDTGCGKTHVSVALVHALRARGLSVAGYKPVAAGCEETAHGRRNEDAEALLAASSPGLSYAEVNPVALQDPIAPHLAAADEACAVDVDSLLAGAQRLAGKADWVVIEGAGGFVVPLNATESLAELPERANWPVILVVGMRLGCLNHALLSAEAIGRRATLAGWVANVLPPEQARLEDNIRSLRERLPVPCLGVVRSADPVAAAAELEIEAILNKI